EIGHVDEDRVEKVGKLVRMDFEIIDIFAKTRPLGRLHAFRQPAHQAGSLVSAQIKPTRTLDAAQPPVELLVMLFSALPVAHRNGYTASFIRYAPISSSASTQSAAPLAIVALGIPLCSACSGSCTTTCPPRVLITSAPDVPSVPVPLRTTPIAYGPACSDID